MKRWIVKHPGIAAYVIAVSSAIAALYGLGHIASAFGLELDAIPAAKPFTHLFIGVSLVISGLVGRSVHDRIERLRDRTKYGDRQSMARAIWERAEQNCVEQTRARGR